MVDRNQLVELSNGVFSLLTKYVEIHDAVFKLSFRKIIPIPGIFKPIDFAELRRKNSHIISGLKEYEKEALDLRKNSAGTEKEYLIHLLACIDALIKTNNQLNVILEGLYQKSQGAFSDYDRKTYNRDVSVYDGLREVYSELGVLLNEARRKL